MILLVKGKFGFRPWPLQSCVTNTLLRHNNKTSTSKSRTISLKTIKLTFSPKKKKVL